MQSEMKNRDNPTVLTRKPMTLIPRRPVQESFDRRMYQMSLELHRREKLAARAASSSIQAK